MNVVPEPEDVMSAPAGLPRLRAITLRRVWVPPVLESAPPPRPIMVTFVNCEFELAPTRTADAGPSASKIESRACVAPPAISGKPPARASTRSISSCPVPTVSTPIAWPVGCSFSISRSAMRVPAPSLRAVITVSLMSPRISGLLPVCMPTSDVPSPTVMLAFGAGSCVPGATNTVSASCAASSTAYSTSQPVASVRHAPVVTPPGTAKRRTGSWTISVCSLSAGLASGIRCVVTSATTA